MSTIWRQYDFFKITESFDLLHVLQNSKRGSKSMKTPSRGKTYNNTLKKPKMYNHTVGVNDWKVFIQGGSGLCCGT